MPPPPPRFIADDKFADVVRELAARGWERSTSSADPTVRLRWRNLVNTPFDRVRASSFVNHLKGSQNLSNKGKLTRLLGALDEGRGAACYPRCHALGPSPAPGSAKAGELALVAALEAMLCDVGVSLAVGALRCLWPEREEDEAVASAAALQQPELLEACVGVAERWAAQLQENLLPDEEGSAPNGFRRSELLSASGTGGFLRKPRAPRRSVLAVGDATWLTLFGHGKGRGASSPRVATVDGLVAALTRPPVGGGGASAGAGGGDGGGDDGTGAASLVLSGRARAVLRRLRALDTHFGLSDAGHRRAAATTGVWIVKPSGLSCGVGIRCLRSLGDVATACAELDFKAVVQKYIERPLLVRGRKFDIRLWVLVTSLRPLVVWSFSDCYLRFSSQRFRLDALDDRMVHLCNFSVQKDSTGRGGAAEEEGGGANGDGANGDGANGDGDEPAIDEEGNMMGARDFARHVEERYGGGAWAALQGEMRGCVLAALRAGRHTMTKVGHGFEWFGFDLMVTAGGDGGGGDGSGGPLRAMLIEANTSPDVSHSTAVTAALVPLATRDLLRLVLDEGGGAAKDQAIPRERLCPAFFPSAADDDRTEGATAAAAADGGGGAESAEEWSDAPGFPASPRWQLWFMEEECADGTAGGGRSERELRLLRDSVARLGAAPPPPLARGGGGGGGAPTPKPPACLGDLIRWVPELAAQPKDPKEAKDPPPPPAAAGAKAGASAAGESPPQPSREEIAAGGGGAAKTTTPDEGGEGSGSSSDDEL